MLVPIRAVCISRNTHLRASLAESLSPSSAYEISDDVLHEPMLSLSDIGSGAYHLRSDGTAAALSKSIVTALKSKVEDQKGQSTVSTRQ